MTDDPRTNAREQEIGRLLAANRRLRDALRAHHDGLRLAVQTCPVCGLSRAALAATEDSAVEETTP